jgi:hypothetical protein
MSKLLVRSAAAGGIVVCVLAAGSGAAFAADPATNAYTPGTTNGNPQPGTGVTPGQSPGSTPVTTVVTGGEGTTSTSGAASSLPFTGFEVGTAAAIGVGALGAGSIFVIGSRRRRRSGTASA